MTLYSMIAKVQTLTEASTFTTTRRSSQSCNNNKCQQQQQQSRSVFYFSLVGTSLRSTLSHESLLAATSAAGTVGPSLQMGANTDVRPVHPSLMPNLPQASAAFAVTGGADHVNRYFAAQSAEEAKNWQESLKKVNRPDLENTRHRENSLKLWIFEAKRLQPKKRYFCEICLNHILYARTTSKEKTADADPFWGEPFEFSNLQDISLVTVKLFREADQKKAKKSKREKNQLVGEIHLPVHEILVQTEQWYPVDTTGSLAPTSSTSLSTAAATSRYTSGGSSKSSNSGPSLRVKSRYLSVDVLPLTWYAGLDNYLMTQYCAAVRALEPRLPVRAKEELARGLVALAHSRHASDVLVADLLLQELQHCLTSSDAAAEVAFRGNSIATKSVEYYLKLVGSGYLRSVLAEPLAILLHSDECCEVDPVRVANSAELEANQRSLRLFAELFWTRVYTSGDRLPSELVRLFAGIRSRTSRELCDQLVASSFFLRFICPAVLGPSLFGLCQELPGPRTARSLTLIAKTVQNLANGTSFGGKEAYMNFMNRFLDQHQVNMASFVASLQTPQQADTASAGATAGAATATAADAAGGIDAGFELAQIHTLLSATALNPGSSPNAIGASGAEQVSRSGDTCLAELAEHVAAVSHCLKFDCPPAPPPQEKQAPRNLHQRRDVDVDDDDDQALMDDAENGSEDQEEDGIVGGGGARNGQHQSAAAAAPTASSAAPTAASNTGSSGYQTYPYHYQPTAAPVSAPSDQVCTEPPAVVAGAVVAQFHNPSYRKPGGRLLQLPSTSAGTPSRREDDNTSTTTTENDDDQEEDPDSDYQDAAVKTPATATTQSSGGGGNSSRVRMGLKSVQLQQQHQQQHQLQQIQNTPASAATGLLDYEAELLQLQRELSVTRQRLEATEARLRTNEVEKARLLAEFQRAGQQQQSQQQQQQAVVQRPVRRQRRELPASAVASVGASPGSQSDANSRQLAEIMDRLRALEEDVRGAAKRPLL